MFVEVSGKCPHCEVVKHQIDTDQEHAVEVLNKVIERHIADEHPSHLSSVEPGLHRFDSGIDWNAPPKSWSDPCCDQDWSGPVHQVPCQECAAVHDVREPCNNDGPDDGEVADHFGSSSTSAITTEESTDV